MTAAGEGEEGGGWVVTDVEQADSLGGSPVKWVGTRLALFKPGTCRCRCSSSNSFHEPSAREVTSKSFGVAHLHHASQRMSLQDWRSVCVWGG